MPRQGVGKEEIMLMLAPSLLAADFSRLGEEIQIIEGEGAHLLHLDVMDGAFVPSISYGAPVIGSLRACTKLEFDVHMMVEEPGRFLEDYVKAGADRITVHAEACRHLDRTIGQIRELGVKAGVALNPSTSLSALDYILNEVDMILLMSVNPGFGGQKYIPYVTEKIQILRSCLNERGLHTDIQVDGGVGLSNVGKIVGAGANVLVAGSAIFKGDIRTNTRAFVELLKEYEPENR